MDGMIFLIFATYAVAQLRDRLPRIPRFNLIRLRQWRVVKRQQFRDRAFNEAVARMEHDESERVRAVILSRVPRRTPRTEEASYATR